MEIEFKWALKHAIVVLIKISFAFTGFILSFKMSKNNLNEIHISHSTQWDSLIPCPIFSLDIYHYPVGRLSKACLIIFQDCAFNKQHSSSVLRVAIPGKHEGLGAVRVELWVGQCSGGDTLGDASTWWNSVSWITPRQNVYACARMSISGLFFSHTFHPASSRLHSVCSLSVVLLHAARVFDYFFSYWNCFYG